MTDSLRRNAALLLLAFLACGALHILLYNRDFADDIAQIVCSVVTILWGVSVKERVTNRRLRRVLILIAAALLLYLLLQIARYNLYEKTVLVNHRLWYLFYIPMTALPVLSLCQALLVHRPEDEPLPPACKAAAAAALVLLALILTNDRHHWFKLIPDDLTVPDDLVKSGWLYYVVSVFQYGSYILAFAILLVKSRSLKGQKLRWLPFVPLLLGILYFLLYPLDIDRRFFPTRIWHIGEMLVFCVIASLEFCIQIGLVPANTNIEKLFSLMDIPVVIFNKENEPIYTSGTSALPLRESEETRIMRQPISGGRVEWAVDIGQISRLNRELSDYTQSIESRNAYLAEEAKTRAEKSLIVTRNRIYDRITGIAQPELDGISGLLGNKEESFDEKLPEIAVRCVFIKRRSNMEFLAENGRLASEECALAVQESLEYIRLCGVSTAMTVSGRATYSAGLVIAVYGQLEKIVEDCLRTLSDLMVSLRFEEGTIGLRVLLNAGALTIDSGSRSEDAFRQTLSVTKSGSDLLLVYTFLEGGERA